MRYVSERHRDGEREVIPHMEHGRPERKPPEVVKKDPRYGLLVEREGAVHSLRTKIARALHRTGFHWSSTCDASFSNVHCTAGLPAGVPDREGRIHFSKATLSKSLAPIAENLALHFALLGEGEA